MGVENGEDEAPAESRTANCSPGGSHSQGSQGLLLARRLALPSLVTKVPHRYASIVVRLPFPLYRTN
jgi:hypothetical protein